MKYNWKICETCSRKGYKRVKGRKGEEGHFFCEVIKTSNGITGKYYIISNKKEVPDNCSRMLEYTVMNQMKI